MKIKSIRILYEIISYLTDKTNGFRPFVKYKLALGTLLIGISATSCKSNPESKTVSINEPIEPTYEMPTCYMPILETESPENIGTDNIETVLYSGIIVLRPQITCYKIVVTDIIPQVYTHAEVMPEFPGGEKEMEKYIRNYIRRPGSDTSIHGDVIVRFVVKENGSLENLQVTRSLSSEYDKEVIRIIQSMPPWIPGKQNGNPVSVYYSVSVPF